MKHAASRYYASSTAGPCEVTNDEKCCNHYIKPKCGIFIHLIIAVRPPCLLHWCYESPSGVPSDVMNNQMTLQQSHFMNRT